MKTPIETTLLKATQPFADKDCRCEVCQKHNLPIPCDGCRLEQSVIWDKMLTPRTNAYDLPVGATHFRYEYDRLLKHARQLEIELAAEKKRADETAFDRLQWAVSCGEACAERDQLRAEVERLKEMERKWAGMAARANIRLGSLVKIAEETPSTIDGKPLRRYMFEQFPACDSHLPVMHFCGRLEQALAAYAKWKEENKL